MQTRHLTRRPKSAATKELKALAVKLFTARLQTSNKTEAVISTAYKATWMNSVTMHTGNK